MSNSIDFINPPELFDPAPFGYSQTALLPANARIAFIAGQGGQNSDGYLPSGFTEQLNQAMKNLVHALHAIGAEPQHVAKLTVLIVNHNQDTLYAFGGAIKALWGQFMTPACTLIPVASLAVEGMLFEIDATVALPMDK